MNAGNLLAMAAVFVVLVVAEIAWSMYRYRKPAAWPERRMSSTGVYTIICLPLAMSAIALSLFFSSQGILRYP